MTGPFNFNLDGADKDQQLQPPQGAPYKQVGVLSWEALVAQQTKLEQRLQARGAGLTLPDEVVQAMMMMRAIPQLIKFRQVLSGLSEL
jgi:hypothetical protein